MASTFEEITKFLLSRKPLPPLLAPPPLDTSKRVSSTPWNQALHDDIARLQNDSTVPLFAIANLHLFNDDIGSCHDIVEKHGGHAIADYLHYILHRREGDYWNAKWWIRQQKSQEFQSVYLTQKYDGFSNQKNLNDLSTSAKLAEAQTRAQGFVDRCEQVEKQADSQEKDHLKQLQWDEMKTVFDFARK
ncbi:unnamed protein product [Adineta ricciae]|uniref:Uncharacterized protein n=1 Tax=Adineta ricciae TaxID=249248 RepID=A0A814K406_ADIRI|nr:unnamed protein product [Adineta ricciae]